MALALSIKTTKGSQITIHADPDLTIYDLKAICWDELETPPEQQTMLFKGNVCNDDATLESLNIENDSTLIVLIKSKKSKKKFVKPSTTAQDEKEEKKTDDANTIANSGNNSLNAMANSNPLLALSGGANNNNLLNMQQTLMQNPDFMKQMMNNPMIQQMMNNPDVLQNIMGSSPAMKKLLDQHPELRHAMKDPALMKQMMKAATDPKYHNELMQNQDRALKNIEAMPGGFNALSRAYSQVQNPMQDAMEDMFRKRFGQSKTKISEVNKNAGPTCKPMDNPWSTSTANDNSNTNTMNAAGTSPNMMNMMNMFNGMNFMNGNNANNGWMNQNGNSQSLYVVQMNELRQMGFYDEQRNLEALTATQGDIDAAIQYLMDQRDRQNNTQKQNK